MPILLILTVLMYYVWIQIAVSLKFFKFKNRFVTIVMGILLGAILALTTIYINICLEDNYIW